MAKKIIIIGAGGHCRTIISILRYYKEFKIAGIADRNPSSSGEKICGISVRYGWKDIDKIYKNGIRYSAIAIGDNKERKNLFSALSKKGFTIPTLTHPSALIEKDVLMGEGNIICMGAKIGTCARIGKNCVVYTGTILDHEVRVGDDVFIAPGCAIAGRVKIGDGSFIGIGSNIKEKILIGKNVTVGAGSVVLQDVPDGERCGGVPAKRLKNI